MVSNILIWGGGGEVLLDGIKDFAAKVGEGFSRADGAPSSPSVQKDEAAVKQRPLPRFRLLVTPHCAHEEMIIDELALGLVKGGDAAKEVETWLSTVLS